MSVFTPDIAPKVIPATTVEVPAKTVTGVHNLPPAGTQMLATLGKTVIHCRVSKSQPDLDLSYPMIKVDIVGKRGLWDENFLGHLSLWIDSGWKFEIVETKR